MASTGGSQIVMDLQLEELMPLALAHLAAGALTTYGIKKHRVTTPKTLFFLFLLSNSPDIDILISWLFTGSPWPLHRTFTHSILFAIIVAAVFSHLSRLSGWIPRLSYSWCYWAVMSHVVADYLFSPWKVAFVWPLSIHPGSLNGILDKVDTFATLAREAQVLLVCLLAYLFIKALGAAVGLVYRLLQPA